MSGQGDFPFAFGEGAADQFKERLKDLMRAQQQAFEEVQAESPMRLGPGAAPPPVVPDNFNVVQQAIALTAAGLGALGPQPTPDAAADAMSMMFARALSTVQGALRGSA